MPESDVMTIDELADYLKIAKSTLYKLSQEGRVPGQKIGKHWRYRRVGIDRWLDGGGPSSSVGERSLDDSGALASDALPEGKQ